MGKQRLLAEIITYSKKYEEELKSSGMDDEEVKVVIKKWVNEVYNTSLTNISSSINAFSFLNSREQEKKFNKVR